MIVIISSHSPSTLHVCFYLPAFLFSSVCEWNGKQMCCTETRTAAGILCAPLCAFLCLAWLDLSRAHAVQLFWLNRNVECRNASHTSSGCLVLLCGGICKGNSSTSCGAKDGTHCVFLHTFGRLSPSSKRTKSVVRCTV